MISILRGSRRTLHGACDGGAVAIEFALLMAFLPLTILACGIVDYGELMAQSANLSAVVRGAAEYARGQVILRKGLPTASQIGSLLNVPPAVFTTSSFCTCADNSAVSCTGTCSVGTPADTRVFQYVVVSGSQSYTPIIPETWSFPGSVNVRTVLRVK